jgi:hypothetical protein
MMVTTEGEAMHARAPIAEFPKWGVAAWLDLDGALLVVELGDYRKTGLKESVDVCAPASQEFLDEVNQAFGTTFQMADFAGR